MKKLVSLLLTLIIALSCAQAALAEEKPAVVDGVRLETENGYVLVITYDARYANPGEKPEVTLTLADGSTQTKTADEALQQVFTDEEKGETYPQLFIQCGEEKPECSVSIGEGAFCDENGIQSPPVDVAAETLQNESYDIHWECDAKQNVLTEETVGPIKTEDPVETIYHDVTGRYRGVWITASRIYLGEAQTESEQNFVPPAGSEQLTVVCRLNDFVWDDCTIIWYDETNDAPNELSSSERAKYALKESFKAIPAAFLVPLIILAEVLPELLLALVAFPLIAGAIPPLLATIPFVPFLVLPFLGEMLFYALAAPFGVIAQIFFPPTERWNYTWVYVD